MQPAIPVALIVMVVVASSCLAAAALGVEILQPAGADTTPFEQIRSTVLNVTPTGHITDNSALTLERPFGIATFEIGGSTYAVVASSDLNEMEKGVQILDVTDPSRITAAGNISDTGELGLDHPRSVAVFKTGGRTYAAVAAVEAVQILDVTDPANPTPTDKISDSGSLELGGAYGIAIFGNGTRTYAAVAANSDNGVQILNLTDPSQVTALGHKDNDSTVNLSGPRNIAVFENGGRTYAAVAARDGDAVQILDVTDPADPTPVGSIADGAGLELDGPEGIATFGNGTHTYAAVAAYNDDTVQILNLTDPSRITALGHKGNDNTVKLNGPRNIAVFENGGRTYAAVAVVLGDAVQVLDVTDPANPTPAGSIGNVDSRKLDGAYDITIFGNGTHTYAAVTAQDDDAVQILRLAAPPADDGSPFVTTWETTGPNETITIPVGDSNASYTVDWGDGTAPTTHTDNATHTYDTTDTYRVSISGGFERIHLGGQPAANAAKLVSIEQWGDTSWTSMEGAFQGASGMVYNATDAPNLSGVGSMRAMFWGASSFDGNISGWNVSSVTDMYGMFAAASSFNQDISTWNVSAVTDMAGMFWSASSFNQDISTWNVSAVTNMASMFTLAASFNQPLNDWNVSSVTNMNAMFASSSFNQSLNNWNVSSVTSITGMFNGATSFNQPLNNWDVSAVTTMPRMFRDASSFNQDISTWNVSRVTDMAGTFSRATSFNQPLNNWDVSAVTDMDGMFWEAIPFNQTLSTWDVSAVTDMEHMFHGASSFNQPLNDWDVSAATNMGFMFWGASSFNQTLSTWDVSAVTSMNGMFNGASSFNQPLNDWDVSAATNMGFMFFGASSFNQPLNDWDVSAVTSMNGMFHGASSFNQPLNDWDVSAVTSMNEMFFGASSFNQPLSSWNVSKVTRMIGMFDSAVLFQQNLGNWYVVPADTVYAPSDVSLNVTTVSAQNSILDGHSPIYGIGSGGNSVLFAMDGNALMFKATPSVGSRTVNVTASGDDVFEGENNWRMLEITVDRPFITTWETTTANETITIPGTGTYTVEWGDGTFDNGASDSTTHTYAEPGNYTVSITGGLESISLDGDSTNAERLQSIEQWGNAGWTNMYRAFKGASNMEYNATDAPDLSGVVSMSGMFRDASSFNGSLSGWDVSSVTVMTEMFRDASSFNGNVSGWNVSKVTDMRSMFPGASSFNQDLSNWDTSSVTRMFAMFNGASSFNGNVSGWDVSKVTGMRDMFSSASSFNGNVSGWDVSKVTDMGAMFSGATSFNQDLNDWNVSKVADMNSMFSGATDFNQPLNDWNVSKVTSMNNMFNRATDFNQPLNDWNVSKVTSMIRMFNGAADFNQPLNDWDVSQMSNMNSMFSGATDFNGNVSSWDVSQVGNMASMFFGATSFDGNVSPWNVSQVYTMGAMFWGAADFNQPLNDWNVSKVTDMNFMFREAAAFNQPLSSWNVSQVTDMSDMFNGATSFDQNLGNWYVVPADTAYDTSEGTLNVTTVSAQNVFLDGHSPTYGIGLGGDSALFDMTGNVLTFKATPSVRSHTVNVTVSGSLLFGGEGNWRELEITVTGEAADDTPPVITIIGDDPLTIQVGSKYTDPGYTRTDDTDDAKDIRCALDTSSLDVDTPGTYTLTYTCTDLSGNQGTATRTVIVAGPVVIDITPTGNIDNDSSLELDGAAGIATFKIGDDTYAAVAAFSDDGVQILNVTDPTAITATDSIDDSDGSLELDSAFGIATFKIGDSTYAAVTSNVDDGVQILDVTDPTDVTATGSIDDSDGSLELDGAGGIAIFGNDTHTYAAVTGYEDGGVQILDVTDPTAITATGSIDDSDGSLELDGRVRHRHLQDRHRHLRGRRSLLRRRRPDTECHRPDCHHRH